VSACCRWQPLTAQASPFDLDNPGPQKNFDTLEFGIQPVDDIILGTDINDELKVANMRATATGSSYPHRIEPRAFLAGRPISLSLTGGPALLLPPIVRRLTPDNRKLHCGWGHCQRDAAFPQALPDVINQSDFNLSPSTGGILTCQEMPPELLPVA